MALDNAGLDAPEGAPAALDPQHVGDIVGAFGTLKQGETGKPRSWRRKLRLLLVIAGPGLIVMGGGNDAGGGPDGGLRSSGELACCRRGHGRGPVLRDQRR